MAGEDDEMEPIEFEEDLLDELDDGDGKLRAKLEGLIPDLVRRTLVAGMGAAVSTEEALRKITKDMSIPKDVASYVASTASATKDEVLRVLARETREFLETVNLSEEIAKMLTTLSFEVKTEIRFIPNDERLVKPDVKANVALRRTEKEKPPRKRRVSRRAARKKKGEPTEE
jgi:hypothetical protein